MRINAAFSIFITKALLLIFIVTTALSSLSSLIINLFALIAPSTSFSLSLFSLQSSDIYLFHCKREKRKKVQLKRFYYMSQIR
jgi:hypothetical protein